MPEAEEELLEAILHLNAQEERLGLELAAEVYATIDRICENPETWPVLRGRVRRAATRRFRYSDFYMIENSGIQVIAISHSSRNPDHWNDRL